MSLIERVAPSVEFSKNAAMNAETYAAWYAQSVNDPEQFWAERAAMLDWMQPWHTVKNTSFMGDVSIRWFEGGQLNVAANCLDRHLATRGDKVAIIWQGDAPEDVQRITYRQLYARVNQCANALRRLGVGKGDSVTIYLPMIPEAAIAMLACTRIGAVHSVVFGGFSPEALRSRMVDGNTKLVITADEGVRGGKHVPLKANVDAALVGYDAAVKVLVVARTEADVPMQAGRDYAWDAALQAESTECAPEPMDAEAPLFMLYTSGSTGTPKGVVHSTAGYLLYAALTTQYVFDLREEDVYWCTADVGWITGHSYLLYGPLANGATTLMFEGVPSYPNPSRFWEVVDAHKVSVFYTAPTAIRALMREGDDYVHRTSRQSLRLLGTVGEPINPEAWRWYYEVVGEGRCPIVDTWWQTETGGHMITPLPGIDATKPGSAMRPFFGVQPVLLTPEGAVIEGEGEGLLCIADSWPGQARTIHANHARFKDGYFGPYPGYYFTGDGARRDADGDWWITGRVDDVLNISGHRIGTAEVESALVAHPSVAEAAVVGVPHPIKGQGIYAFVLLKEGIVEDAGLVAALKQEVRKHIGAIATPDTVVVAPGLPKTRSGKIMRRILRKIACDEADGLGDVSTLQNPEIVAQLVALHAQGVG